MYPNLELISWFESYYNVGFCRSLEFAEFPRSRKGRKDKPRWGRARSGVSQPNKKEGQPEKSEIWRKKMMIFCQFLSISFLTIYVKNGGGGKPLKSKRLVGQTFWREMIESGEFDLRFQSFRQTRFIKNGEHSIAYRLKARISGYLLFKRQSTSTSRQRTYAVIRDFVSNFKRSQQSSRNKTRTAISFSKCSKWPRNHVLGVIFDCGLNGDTLRTQFQLLVWD